jgi:RNA polymerase sigma-54 factor
VLSEDTNNPYSDQDIVNLLKQANIVIARRTVAKYREMLGLLSSSKRKRVITPKKKIALQ